MIARFYVYLFWIGIFISPNSVYGMTAAEIIFEKQRANLEKEYPKENMFFISLLCDYYLETNSASNSNSNLTMTQDFAYQDCKNKATKARGKYEANLKAWQNGYCGSLDYVSTAREIANHIEWNEYRYLTLGQMVCILGNPDEVTHSGYYMSDNLSMNGKEARLNIYYKKQNIVLSFSVSGFMISISMRKSNNLTEGDSEIYWPHKHYYHLLENPIVVGNFGEKTLLELKNKANALVSSFKTQGDWFYYLYVLQDQREKSELDESDMLAFKSLKDDCDAQIVMIDYIKDDLAKVYYQVISKSDKILYCDTWWCLTEGMWSNISPRNAEGIMRKTKGSEAVEGK